MSARVNLCSHYFYNYINTKNKVKKKWNHFHFHLYYLIKKIELLNN